MALKAFWKATSEAKVQEFLNKYNTAEVPVAIAGYNAEGDNDVFFSVGISNEEIAYMKTHGVLYVRITPKQASNLFPKKKTAKNKAVYLVTMVKELNGDNEYFDKIMDITKAPEGKMVFIHKDLSLTLEENIEKEKDNPIYPPSQTVAKEEEEFNPAAAWK